MKTVFAILLSIQAVAAHDARAQTLSPVAVLAERTTSASTDTVPIAPFKPNATGTIIGGALGVGVGAVAGTLAGVAIASGCHDEYCALGSAALGFVIGESVGVAIGAHLGSGSPRHGRLVLSALSAGAIFIGGTMLGVAMGQFGDVMIPAIPVMQVYAAYAIESGK